MNVYIWLIVIHKLVNVKQIKYNIAEIFSADFSIQIFSSTFYVGHLSYDI